jgi:mono/diheme cytochrome c family protein
MIGTIVGLLVLLVLVVLFGWLAKRAWGSKSAIVKWPGVILTGLLTLVFLLVFVLALMGTLKLYAPGGSAAASVKVAGTPEQLARGAKLAGICVGCHSTAAKFPLDGSKDDFLVGPDTPPIGSIYPPNLTPAGEIKDWTDGEIIRAIREGIHKNGRALVIMPSEDFHSFSDADVQALVAYLRSQPATPNKPQNDTPSNSLNLLGTLFIGGGLFPTAVQAPITQPIVAPPEGTTAEYGKYLVDITGCRGCHGADLAGGAPGFGPIGPNLTVLLPKWSEADFIKAIRTGVDPTGKALDPEQMPWKEYSAFASDNDLKAYFAYLHGLASIDKSSAK